MFAPNQEMVAGFRDGDHKYMYSLARGTAHVYDLISDQAEQINLADATSERRILGEIAGWLKEQHRRYVDIGYYTAAESH